MTIKEMMRVVEMQDDEVTLKRLHKFDWQINRDGHMQLAIRKKDDGRDYEYIDLLPETMMTIPSFKELFDKYMVDENLTFLPSTGNEHRLDVRIIEDTGDAHFTIYQTGGGIHENLTVACHAMPDEYQAFYAKFLLLG